MYSLLIRDTVFVEKILITLPRKVEPISKSFFAQKLPFGIQVFSALLFTTYVKTKKKNSPLAVSARRNRVV